MATEQQLKIIFTKKHSVTQMFSCKFCENFQNYVFCFRKPCSDSFYFLFSRFSPMFKKTNFESTSTRMLLYFCLKKLFLKQLNVSFSSAFYKKREMLFILTIAVRKIKHVCIRNLNQMLNIDLQKDYGWKNDKFWLFIGGFSYSIF